LERLLAVAPADTSAGLEKFIRYKLAECYFRMNDWPKALAAYGSFLRRYKTKPTLQRRPTEPGSGIRRVPDARSPAGRRQLPPPFRGRRLRVPEGGTSSESRPPLIHPCRGQPLRGWSCCRPSDFATLRDSCRGPTRRRWKPSSALATPVSSGDVRRSAAAFQRHRAR
jgi:hypothetical protein